MACYRVNFTFTFTIYLPLQSLSLTTCNNIWRSPQIMKSLTTGTWFYSILLVFTLSWIQTSSAALSSQTQSIYSTFLQMSAQVSNQYKNMCYSPRPSFFGERNPLVTRLCGSQNRCEHFGDEKYLLFLPESEQRFLFSPSYSLDIIPTELSLPELILYVRSEKND